MDWKRFDQQMKEMAKQMDCRVMVHELGLSKGRVPTGIKASVKIRCPEPSHEDKNPSCAVYRDGFKCLACGERGDIFTLVKLLEGKDVFVEQIKHVLTLRNIDYEAERQRFIDSERKNTAWKPVVIEGGQRKVVSFKKETISLKRHELAHQIWQEALRGFYLEREGALYLKSRQISEQLANSMGIVQVSYEDWSQRIKQLKKKYTADVLDEVGLLSEKGNAHPYLDDFLIFPYMVGRRIESMRFRRLAPTDRYNGSKYLSLIGAQNGTRAQYNATSSGVIQRTTPGAIHYVVEGEINALSLMSMGRNVTGIPGAMRWDATWSTTWDNNVVVLLDPDDAAQKLQQDILAGCTDVQRPMVHFHTVQQGEARDANDLLCSAQLEAFVLGIEYMLLDQGF